MAFKYNIIDAENIPGLKRPWEKGVPFLTPVFFDLEVLVRYFYDPRYQCQFYGETYGKIQIPESAESKFSYHFPFGINTNGKVVAWLGDLNKLGPKEKLYLTSHNVESDGNIESEFYDGQIGIQFADPIREVEIVLFKSKLNDLTQRLYSFCLYKTTEKDVSKVIALCSKYKRIMFNSEDDIKRFLSIWNEDLIEDLNVAELKRVLREKDIQYDGGIGGLKLLEKFLQEVVAVQDNIIAPLFYLYDLRLWADHKEMQKKYDAIIKLLGVSASASFGEVYHSLIDRIQEFYVALNSLLLKKVPD